MTHRGAAILGFTVGLTMVSTSGLAQAEEMAGTRWPMVEPETGTPGDSIEEEDRAEPRNLVGAKGTMTRKIGPEASLTESGAMLFYERAVVPRWLDVEIAAGALAVMAGGAAYPVELLLKKPFELGSSAALYVAAGPTMVVEAAEETRASFGYVTMAGAYLWATKAVGLDLEVGYGGLFEEDGYAHEVTLAVGPVMRF